MAYLTRADIDAAKDIKVEDLEVPEWGGTVRVRGLTGGQRSDIEATMVAINGQRIEIRREALREMRLRVVASSLVDGDGRRMFSDKELNALAEKSASAIDRIFDKAH